VGEDCGFPLPSLTLTLILSYHLVEMVGQLCLKPDDDVLTTTAGAGVKVSFREGNEWSCDVTEAIMSMVILLGMSLFLGIGAFGLGMLPLSFSSTSMVLGAAG